MNLATTQPVIALGAISGILSAAWYVLVANEVFAWMADLDSLNALVYLVIPVIAAFIARRFTTSLAAPNLPVGTVVNSTSDLPTGIVVEKV